MILEGNAPVGIGCAYGHFYWRTTIAFVCAGLVLWRGWLSIIHDPKQIAAAARLASPPDLAASQTNPVANAIAFDALAFTVLGFSVLISAADRWPGACLWAGAAMFAGAFLGLLFGVPYTVTPGNAAATPQVPATAITSPPTLNSATLQSPPVLSAPASGSTAMSQHGQTLIVETTSWISKLLAGATLAQFGAVEKDFLRTAHAISGYVVCSTCGPGCDEGHAALGAAVLLYFGLLGFLAGLILPSSFKGLSLGAQ